MHKPLYHYLYIKSPIAKIAIGILALVVTLAVLGGIIVTEVPRMEAQTANWNGRSIEKVRRYLPATVLPVTAIMAKVQ